VIAIIFLIDTDAKQRKKAELEERDFKQYTNTCTFQPFLISKAPARIKQVVRRDEKKHTKLVSLEEKSSTPFIAGEAVSEVINPQGNATYTGHVSIGMKQCTINKTYSGNKASGALVAAQYVNSRPQPPVSVSNFTTETKQNGGVSRSLDSIPRKEAGAGAASTSSDRKKRISGASVPISRGSNVSSTGSVATSTGTGTVNSGRYAQQQANGSGSQASSASSRKYNYSQPELNSYLAMFDQSCNNPDLPLPVFGAPVV